MNRRSFVFGCSILTLMAAPVATLAQDVTLEIWFPGNSAEEMKIIKEKVIPAFTAEHPGVAIKAQFVDWGSISPKLLAAFASNSAPDIFGHGPAFIGGLAVNDRLMNLDKWVASLPEADRTDLQASLAAGKFHGHYFMAPTTAGGSLFAYRTDFFTEVGLDTNNPPTDWTSLRDAAEKLVKVEGGRMNRAGIMTSIDPIAMTQTFSAFLYQAGGELIDTNGQPAFAGPKGIEALTYMTGLYLGDNPVSMVENYGNVAAPDHPLVTGRAGIALVSPNELNRINAAGLMKNIAVMPPITEAASGAFGGTTGGLMVNADTKHPDQALAFITLMTSPDIIRAWSQLGTGVPVRPSVAEGAYYNERPYLGPFTENFSIFKPNPIIPEWIPVREVLAKHIEAAMLGQVTPEAALTAAAAEASSLIAGN